MTNGLHRRSLVSAAVEELAASGVESPEADAVILLAHVLGVELGQVALVDTVRPELAAIFRELVSRRATRVPLQHLTGIAAFRLNDLAVGPGVFVPRPETEVMAGWVIDRARELVGRGHAPRVVDLATGSGAIALAVATEVPEAEVHAVELEESALVWAARNLQGSSVDLRPGDMADAFADLDGRVDIVVSNPPYIPLEAFESVAVEVRDHDPALALWSGEDGLDAIRVVATVAARLLRPLGTVAVEHADVQGESVPAIFAARGEWRDIRDHPDLAGRARFTTAVLAR